jgi:hypothetical protein
MKLPSMIVAAMAATCVLTGQGLAQSPAKPEPSASPAKAGTADSMKGQHSMEGEVTKVDAKKGWVDVKTPEGRMKLHFPPAALASVKKGDRVTVEIGMTPGPAAAK